MNVISLKWSVLMRIWEIHLIDMIDLLGNLCVLWSLKQTQSWILKFPQNSVLYSFRIFTDTLLLVIIEAQLQQNLDFYSPLASLIWTFMILNCVTRWYLTTSEWKSRFCCSCASIMTSHYLTYNICTVVTFRWSNVAPYTQYVLLTLLRVGHQFIIIMMEGTVLDESKPKPSSDCVVWQQGSCCSSQGDVLSPHWRDCIYNDA